MSGEDKKKIDDEDSQDANLTHIVQNPQDFPTMLHSMRESDDEAKKDTADGDAYATQYLAKAPDTDMGTLNLPSNDASNAEPLSDSSASPPKDSSTASSSSSSTNGPVGPISFDNDIPGFVIERELGRGAFGVVYCARDELLDRRVAIKKPLFSNPAHRQQYIDEARKAVKLDHPMIVPIFQVGMTSKGEPFVVQKLIEGTNLRQMLSGNVRLSLPQTIGIMRQVCMAVDAAHAAGIVHRDLKPENLLVDHDNRVYVADFGLAVLDEDENPKKDREIAGTPHYMSPEQFVGRLEWLDGRSDIWALGIILYELLSGKPPFTGKNLIELKDQIKNKDPRPIHQRDPKIPSEFDVVFRKCCAKKMADRYSSARELMAALDTIAETLPFRETATFESLARSNAASMSHITGATAAISNIASQADSLRNNASRGMQSHLDERATLRTSMGHSTIRNSDSVSHSWKKYAAIGIPITILAIMGVFTLISSGMFGARNIAKNDDPSSQTPQSNGSMQGADSSNPSPNANAATGTSTSEGIDKSNVATTTTPSVVPDVKTTVPLVPVLPSKPFIVAIDGSGTHTSISKAILDSSSGDTISIRQGTYRETILLDRSIHLIGQGNVSIIATQSECMVVQADSRSTIEGFHLESQAPSRNTIVIEKGNLKLVKCNVFASSQESYNCVKIRPLSVLDAKECKFQSTVHANISAEKGSFTDIRECAFSFAATTFSESKRVCVQAIGARGNIENCEFIGPCMAGIDWLDAADEVLTIQKSRFRNCTVGIQVKGCGREGKPVLIHGTVGEPMRIVNAMWGVSVKRSHVDISEMDIDLSTDGETERNVGIQVTESSIVQCSDVEVRKAACGILVKQSKMKIDGLIARDTSFVGMLVDGSQITGTLCHLLNSSTYGLVMVGKNPLVELDSMHVSLRPTSDSDKSRLAVYLASGKLEFKNGLFENSLSAFTVDPSRLLINATGMPEKRTLIEILGDPDLVKIAQSPVTIKADSVIMKDCKLTWIFHGPGASEIKSIKADPKSEETPRLTKSSLDRLGNDVHNFTVVDSQN